MAVLDDLECKIFFVGQPWWPTFEEIGVRKGGGREGKGTGEEGRRGEGREWEGITADSIENPYFDPCFIRNCIFLHSEIPTCDVTCVSDT